MKFNKTFATILTLALTTGVNVSVMAAPNDVKNIKEDRIETTEKNDESDKTTKPSKGGSQGRKCIPLYC